MATPPLKLPKAVAEQAASWYTGPLVLGSLLIALMLSAYNLSLTVDTTGRLGGLSQSWDVLLGNYGSRVIAPAIAATAGSPEGTPPVLLWSIVRFRGDEETSLPRDLVTPLFAQYEGSANPVSVLLIERKNVGSRDVSVRLFFKDGTELQYLWPSTHATPAGVWRVGE